ncbi:MAG: hypothetical protein P3M74_00080 [Candidatus Hodgkinia cicadicola]|nr:MAG: hypothetical protein P3M74_00080 [Candidatus Hodgkinia cicadicola]
MSKLCVELARSKPKLMSAPDFRLVATKLFADQFGRFFDVVAASLMEVWDNTEFWFGVVVDLITAYVRDLASCCVVTVFSMNGVKALFLYRLSRCCSSSKLKLLLSNVMSLACGCELSSSASIGKFVLLDHASGVVIGQQAVVGNNAVVMHGVTLGSAGNRVGLAKRHPVVGAGVYLGASSKVLGSVVIGHCGCVSANTVVTKRVLPYNTVVNLPARVLI